jgi:hypothetical protein
MELIAPAATKANKKAADSLKKAGPASSSKQLSQPPLRRNSGGSSGMNGSCDDGNANNAGGATPRDRFHEAPFRPKTFWINFRPEILVMYLLKNNRHNYTYLSIVDFNLGF